MHTSSALRLDEKEGKDRAKAEIRHRQEVTRPNLMGMVVQKGGPAFLEEGPMRPRLMYFWMVRFETWMPGLGSSPQMRSAPHERLEWAITLINITVSAGILGWNTC